MFVERLFLIKKASSFHSFGPYVTLQDLAFADYVFLAYTSYFGLSRCHLGLPKPKNMVRRLLSTLIRSQAPT